MAGDDLIERYLDDLHQRVATWHPRPDDVVAEAADHLGERVDTLVAAGRPHPEAVAEALRRYGSADHVAAAHLRSARRPAVPTELTRTAGLMAVIAGAGWVALPVLAGLLPDGAPPLWFVLASVFHVTVAATVVAGIGLWQRHGGLGPLGWVAVVPAVLAVPFVLFVWPVPAWVVLLGAATAVFGLAVLRRGVAPRAPTAAMTVGLGVAAAAVVGAELFVDPGSEDFAFAASPSAMVAMVTGFVALGSGLAGVGRWMRSETPVTVPPLPAPSAGPARPVT